jgi:hypothetical protein
MATIKKIGKYLLLGDHILTHLRRSVLFHIRYALARIRIFVYRHIHGYPACQVFLQIPLSQLNYTEFNEAGEAGYRYISSRNVYRIIGKVIGGDWDLQRTHIERWTIFRSLKQHLIDGVDLRSTEYYIADPVANGTPLRGIWYQITEENYAKELNRNQNLFRQLRERGYMSQRELRGPDPLDEIRVKIGRNGEFLWENSIHRFVLAKLLHIPNVTVVVTVRHPAWVELRKALISLSRGYKGGDARNARTTYDHPDLKDIPYCPEGEVLLREHIAGLESSVPRSSVAPRADLLGDPQNQAARRRPPHERLT